ncbi:MAG TPA: hypothetical protein VFM54_20045 [Micromonosporaceae bacterium]|nr:hypothetical protein [Micromonosporaceae bacterium]
MSAPQRSSVVVTTVCDGTHWRAATLEGRGVGYVIRRISEGYLVRRAGLARVVPDAYTALALLRAETRQP